MKSLCLLSLFLLGNIPVTLGQSVKTPVANDNIHLEQELERRSNSKYLFTQALLDQKEARRTVVPEYSTSTFNFGKLNPQQPAIPQYHFEKTFTNNNFGVTKKPQI